VLQDFNREKRPVAPASPLDLPESVRAAQRTALADLGVSWTDGKEIAQAVMALSAFYVKHPEKSSPWSEVWARQAYLAYYMPLNWWRLCGVVGRGQQLNFFDKFDHYIDFGSGLGSLGFALDEAHLIFQSGICVERAHEAVHLHRRLAVGSKTPLEWRQGSTPGAIKPRTLACFSYSLTELTKLPDWVSACDGLMIVEPATRDDSRKLQALRGELLAQGWHVWGPCTHAEPCPLLSFSERDWCHDRFQWTQPDWLTQIERHMPIKNGTLPCSWLMMRRDPPAVVPARDPSGELSQPNPGRGRMTGDLQEFKGFSKQLICKGGAREFVAWQRRDFKKSYPEIGRGDLVSIGEGLETKGNEIRPKTADDIRKV
jgi:Mitochondrial small ribosomal subunit Rsm22